MPGQDGLRVLDACGKDQARLDTLKSVSVGRKVVMLADGRSDRFRRMRQMDAEWELAELEDNLFKFPWSGAT